MCLAKFPDFKSTDYGVYILLMIFTLNGFQSKDRRGMTFSMLRPQKQSSRRAAYVVIVIKAFLEMKIYSGDYAAKLLYASMKKWQLIVMLKIREEQLGNVPLTGKTDYAC